MRHDELFKWALPYVLPRRLHPCALSGIWLHLLRSYLLLRPTTLTTPEEDKGRQAYTPRTGHDLDHLPIDRLVLYLPL